MSKTKMRGFVFVFTWLPLTELTSACALSLTIRFSPAITQAHALHSIPLVVSLGPSVSDPKRPPDPRVIATVWFGNNDKWAGDENQTRRICFNANLICTYSLRYSWYVHFLPQSRCNPASSTLGMVFPRSRQPDTMIQSSYQSIFQLQGSKVE